MNCPACGLSEKYLKDDKDTDNKSICTGCGTIFFNRDKVF